METATLAAPATQVYEKTAKESHDENVLFAQQNNLPYIAITGNTFPCNNALWAMGGRWNRDLKVQEVPQHRAAEAQALADRFAPKPKVVKPVVAKVVKAKVAKPVAVKVPAKVEAVPHGGNLIGRGEVLLRMIGKLETDVDATRGDDELLRAALVSLTAARMGIDSALKGLKGE